VQDRIKSYALLKEGWDSYGGKPASPASVADATAKATEMERLGFPVPHVVLCSNGQYAFEWSSDLVIETDAE
jgi:hypothetical protein